MGNVTAAITEGQSVAKGYSDKHQAFVFRIPVYNNMPAAAVSFTEAGNPNNYLKTLSVSGLSLTPAFSPATTSYSLVVANSVSSINVTANSVSAKATISGTGNYNLSVGNNTIKINCKSQKGEVRTYTLLVSRQEAVTEPAAPTVSEETKITSGMYTIGNIITGIAAGTTVDELKTNITVTSGSIEVLNVSGERNTGILGTGNKVALYNAEGSLVGTYDIVIYGDVNGDGMVNALDMIKVNRHILGISSLSGTYLEAADANRQGDGVNALDMIIMNRHILGLTTIRQ
jgi:hypothetical protein